MGTGWWRLLTRPPRTRGGPRQGLRVAVHPFDVLLLAAPVALAAERLHGSTTVLFFASGVAIVPLARLIGLATEALASRLGTAAGRDLR